MLDIYSITYKDNIVYVRESIDDALLSRLLVNPGVEHMDCDETVYLFD